MSTAWLRRMFERGWVSDESRKLPNTIARAAIAAALVGSGAISLAPRPAWAQQASPAAATPATPAQSASPAPAPEEAKVLALVERMTNAVLATDIAAYISCVDKADPVFLQEQKNWAKDLDRKPVAEFSIAAAKFRAQSEGEIIADLTMTWKLKGSESARSLKYAGRFVDRKGEWLYAGENWKVLERDNIKVFFDEGRENVAGIAADVLPAIRAHVHEGFALTIDRVQEVKLYSSMQHLQQSIYLSYTDGISGWNEPGESIKMVASAHPDKEGLTSVLAHEYGHVCTFELGPKANEAPWWVLEGVAELSSEHYADKGQFAQRAVRRMAKSGRLREWDALSDFHNTKQADMQMVYTQGHAMLGYISERFGREKRVVWLKAMATGSSLDVASKAAFDLSFAEVDRQWRDSLLPQEEAAPAPAEPASKE
ncbi:MAG: hypothetical protein JNL50_04975 [Phycisphaerae bacterium]|nr:hypothetical protein [Phycisphaerae bacterium]